MLKPIREVCQDDYGDSAPLYVLLVAEIRIHGDQHIEMTFRKFQQFPVLFASLTGLLNG